MLIYYPVRLVGERRRLTLLVLAEKRDSRPLRGGSVREKCVFLGGELFRRILFES